MKYSDGLNYCIWNGMQGLLAIRNVEELNGIRAAFISIAMWAFNSCNGPRFIVDGIQAANGSWFVYNPNPTPLYSGAFPPTGAAGYTYMHFIGVSPQNTFMPLNNIAAFSSWFACEFDVV
jgi:hypothetical protein